MKRKYTLLILYVVIFALFGSIITGCLSDTEQSSDYGVFTTYPDIPGITQDEIDAIEALQSKRTTLIYASSRSTELFEKHDGTLSGYTVFFCQWLSELFGIEFQPVIQGLGTMLENLSSGEIQFATLSDTPERRETYYMTNPIAQRSIKAILLDNSKTIAEISRERLPRYVFTEGSVVLNILAETVADGTYEVVIVPDEESAYWALKDNIADAFIANTIMEAAFDHYGDVHTEDFLPLIFLPAAMAAEDPEFEPVISLVTKALENGAYEYLTEQYKQGYREYRKHKFSLLLTEEESVYLQSNTTIPFASQYMSYPVSFYNTNSGEWEGIVFDIMSEIQELTGLEFVLVNDQTTELPELLALLERGDAYVMPNLIQSDERMGRFIWTDTIYQLDKFALISKRSYPNVDLNDIPYEKIGFAEGSAFSDMFRAWFPNALYAKEYPSNDAAFAALENGEINLVMTAQSRLAALTNYYEFSEYKANYLFNTDFKGTFGFNKDQIVLCSIINKALIMIDTDKIVEEWKGITHNLEAMQLRRQRPWLIGAIMLSLVALALLFFILTNNIKERKKIAKLLDREKKISETELRQSNLLSAVNSAAAFLLNNDIESFDTSLHHSMKIMAEAVNADRMYIWKNHTENGELYCTQVYEWSGGAEPQQSNKYTIDIPYSENVAGLQELLTSGKCLNGIVREMNSGFQSQLVPQGIVSIIIMPVFLKDEFWGFVGLDDCHNERIFTQQEENVLRSSSLLFAHAYQRNEALQNLRETSAALEKAIAEAERVSRYKTDFLAKMSHEIRTPMNAIIGMSELALRESEPDNKDEHIYTVRQAGYNLLTIVNDILDFSKIEAGKLEITPKEYVLATLLGDVIDIIKMRAAGSHLHFAVKADSKIPRILYGDETKIRQAILNVSNNAVKFTESGSIALGVYGEFTGADNINLVFEISDTGIGIKPEDTDRIFGDFSRVESEKNRSIEGTGLGLAITRSFVEAMGGNIKVESVFGEGSKFTVTIPQKIRSDDTLAKVAGAETKRVLVYERRKVYADSIVYSLSNLGVEHTLVSKGVELSESMESKTYDCLIIPFSLWKRNKDTVLKYGEKIKPVILTDFGKVIPDSSLSTLTMPAYCIHIANILNGVIDDERTRSGNTEQDVSFTAPEARILIVDDMVTNLKVAKGLLKPYNMQVDVCSSGEDAIEEIQGAVSGNERYDLVLMDHLMPGMDGVETTRHIRELGKHDPYFEEIPIIALTANAVSGTMEMLIDNGFSDFLSKPVDIVELNSALEKWIPKEKQQK